MGSRKIHFNQLPEDVRERLIQCTEGLDGVGPIHFDPVGGSMSTLGFIILILGGVGGIMHTANQGYGSIWSDDMIQESNFALIYIALWFIICISILSLLYRRVLKRALPIKPGRYMLAQDIMIVTSDVIELLPMSDLREFQATHQYTNGRF